MTLDTFFHNFELLADAPGGVPKLRELILQLAVQGKLVPQDPADEPASVQLERIHAERNGQGKLWQTDPQPIEDVPYQLPPEWAWARMDDLAIVAMGNSPPGSSYNEQGVGVPLINGPVEFSAGPFGKTIKSKFTTSPTKFCEEDDLLICVRGSTTGRTNIAGFPACIGRGVAAIRAFIHQPYLNYLILSKRQDIYNLGTGSTFPSVSYDQLAELLVPLPPTAEQRRIVAKVDQLMALCDQLEARQQQRREARQRLNDAALDHLLAASNADEFAAHWQRLRDNFALLYDTPDTVNKLRQAILQLAVQGKLVPQDPNDEPASVLLEKIRAARNGQGKLWQTEPQPVQDAPYPVPDGWQWAQLDELLTLLRNGVSTQPNATSGTPILRISALRPNVVNIEDVRYFSEPVSTYQDFQLTPGDLLFTRYSGNRDFVGICGVVPKFQGSLVYPDKLIRGCVVAQYLSPEYIALAMNVGPSRAFVSQFLKTTAGQVGIAGKDLKLTPIPLPPLAEQRRIVAKVDQLMALCDELEGKLRAAQDGSAALLAAVAREVVAANVTAA